MAGCESEGEGGGEGEGEEGGVAAATLEDAPPPPDDAPQHPARRPMNAFLIFCKRHRAQVSLCKYSTQLHAVIHSHSLTLTDLFNHSLMNTVLHSLSQAWGDYWYNVIEFD